MASHQSNSQGLPDQEVVRIGGPLYPPYVEACASYFPRNCSAPGYDIAMIYRAVTVMGYRAEIFLDPDFAEKVVEGVYNVSGIMMPFYDARVGATQPALEDRVLFLIPEAATRTLDKDFLLSSFKPAVYVVLLTALTVCRTPQIAKFFGASVTLGDCFKIGEALWHVGFGIFLGVFSSFLAISHFQPPRIDIPFDGLHGLSKILQEKRCRLVLMENYEIIAQIFNRASHTSLGLDLANETLTEIEAAYQINPPIAMHGNSTLAYRTLGRLLLQAKECRIGVIFESALPRFLSQNGVSRELFMIKPTKDVGVLSYKYWVTKNTKLEDDLFFFFSGGSAHQGYQEEVGRQERARVSREPVVPVFEEKLTLEHPLALSELRQGFNMLFLLCGLGFCIFVAEIFAWLYSRRSVVG